MLPIATSAALAALLPGATTAAAASAGYSVSLVPVGAEPWAVAMDSATDTAYVADMSAHQLSVLDGATGTVTATLTLAGPPRGVAVDPVTDTVYVSEDASTAGLIAVIDGATDKVTATITEPAGTLPIGIAVDSATNTVYVANSGAEDVAVINGASNLITGTIGTGTHPERLAVDESTNVVWVANPSGDSLHGSVLAINAATDAMSSTSGLASNSDPTDIAVDPATDTAYASDGQNGDVAVIDGSTDAVSSTIATVGGHPIAVTADPAASTIYAIGTRYTWVIDRASNAITDTLDRGGVALAVNDVTGTAYAAGGLRPDVWIIAPAAANAWSPIITSASYAIFTTGLAGTFTAAASALPAARFTEAGALPAGVTLNPDGTFSGTPAAGSGGSYPITLTADNGVAPSYSQAFTLTVTQPPTITSGSSATFMVGSYGNIPLTATGNPAPSFSIGNSPPWLGLTSNTSLGQNELAATPPIGSGGVYHVELVASNSVATVRQAFTLTVDQAPAITSARHATFRAGHRHSFTFRASGFPAPKFSERGRLPRGVKFRVERNGTAIVTGDPSRADIGKTYVITITARNGIGPAVHQTFRLTIS